jgi:hypothetical protein
MVQTAGLHRQRRHLHIQIRRTQLSEVIARDVLQVWQTTPSAPPDSTAPGGNERAQPLQPYVKRNDNHETVPMRPIKPGQPQGTRQHVERYGEKQPAASTLAL